MVNSCDHFVYRSCNTFTYKISIFFTDFVNFFQFVSMETFCFQCRWFEIIIALFIKVVFDIVCAMWYISLLVESKIMLQSYGKNKWEKKCENPEQSHWTVIGRLPCLPCISTVVQCYRKKIDLPLLPNVSGVLPLLPNVSGVTRFEKICVHLAYFKAIIIWIPFSHSFLIYSW